MLTAKVTTTICSGPAVHLRLPQKWNVDFKGNVNKGKNYKEINNRYNGNIGKFVFEDDSNLANYRHIQ